MTREERNVLVFLAVGILLGSWPRDGREEAETASSAPLNGAADRSAEVVVVDFFPIDLNDASVELLSELPGIGPAKARAIVERRQQGPFRTVEELAEVRGIGPKTVERLRPFVTVERFRTGE
ncbi:MAG: hypothetical protein DHS20C21_06010 [Gemmatimonadota bacterium]|nr:MAG: hypothetical protein DHS20C21_06010 [Gemmatimonadota bacterium]